MLKNLGHCLCAQLRHQISKIGYHSKAGWVYIEVIIYFINRGGMSHQSVKDCSGMVQGCISYSQMPKNPNPLHCFKSGLPPGFIVTPHLIYDMIALDQAYGQNSRYQLMRRIGSAWPIMISSDGPHQQ